MSWLRLLHSLLHSLMPWRRAPARIPDALWDAVIGRHPFLLSLPAYDQARLRELSSEFLAVKEFSGAGGLVVTDEMALSIAVQAVRPLLRLAPHTGTHVLQWYDDFVGIVVHPDAVVAPREHTDEHGVVHHYQEELAGEAMEGGPVMLSWHDVRQAGSAWDQGYNVVIHEFAHVLDMGDGLSDGVPPLPAAARAAWIAVIEPEFELVTLPVPRSARLVTLAEATEIAAETLMFAALVAFPTRRVLAVT